MKAEDLLHAVGSIDEQILAREETSVRRGIAPWKYILVAAIVVALATSVLAVGYVIKSKPIGNVQVSKDPTAFPFTMDDSGNISHDPMGAVLISMETKYDTDAPDYLAELYEITPPEGWMTAGHRAAGDNWIQYEFESLWQMDGKPGWIKLGQTTAKRHKSYGENCVDVLYDLNINQPITTQKVRIAELEMLKVCIPPHEPTSLSTHSNFCEDGEIRLYWCDGQYVIYFAYPQWLEDSKAEEILNTLTVRNAPWSYPQNYGDIDHQRIGNATGDFHMEGLTVPQYVYLYSDNCIWFGATNYIMKYHTQTEKLEKIYVGDGQTNVSPRYLYDAGDYIGYYANDTQYRVHKNGQKVPEAIGEGYQFDFFYDMWSYAIEGTAIVRTNIITGEKENLVQGITSMVAMDDTIRTLPEDSSSEYRFYNMDCSSCEIVPRDPRWLNKATVGNTTVYTAQYGKLYIDNNGVVTSLGIKVRDTAVYNDKLYYTTDQGATTNLCVYDPKTETHEIVVADVFEFAIVGDRYLACTKTDGQSRTRSNVHVVQDLQSGKQVQWDLTDMVHNTLQ